ncbi:blue-sensitive opsin-like [Rhopilema esculentum]|uniref:blue-sensitive opsin-like n=1 Tax=Rhopilema esculentum TaxID=499914 RepID=UPI0031CF824C
MATTIMLQFLAIIINSVAAITLNSFLFALVYGYQNLRTDFNYTILSVCSADIVVSLQISALSIASMVDENVLKRPTACDINGLLSLVGFGGSVIGLAANSFYRAVMICKNDMYLKYLSGFGTKLYIMAAWIFTLMISVPPLFSWSKFSVQNGMLICFVDWKSDVSYTVFMVLICFLGPIIIITSSTLLILKRHRAVAANLQESSQAVRKQGLGRTIHEKRKKRDDQIERKITMSIFAVALTFFLAWGPFVVIIILETSLIYHIPDWLKSLGIILGSINSTTNPVIHLTMNKNFRNAAAKAWRKIIQSLQLSLHVNRP